jgi:hypothetical protein
VRILYRGLQSDHKPLSARSEKAIWLFEGIIEFYPMMVVFRLNSFSTMGEMRSPTVKTVVCPEMQQLWLLRAG